MQLCWLATCDAKIIEMWIFFFVKCEWLFREEQTVRVFAKKYFSWAVDVWIFLSGAVQIM
jgi:hypothetical protein